MIREVRKEYLDICATLDPGFNPCCVHWPRKDVLCSPIWTTSVESVLTQKQNHTTLLPPALEQQRLHVAVDTNPCLSAYPNHVATSTEDYHLTNSTEETVPMHLGPTSLLLSTTEHEEQQDGSAPSLKTETGSVSPLPAAADTVEPEVCSPLGGLQTSTLGSVSDLSVSSLQLSMSAEGDTEVESEGRTNRQGDANGFKQGEEGESDKTPLANASEQHQLHSVTLDNSPPKTLPVKEGPTVEAQKEEVVCEAEREDTSIRSDDAVPDAPEELFFREISAIIASAEQEGKSYEELKAQLELELVWVKQAIHSRQQASVATVLMCCVCVWVGVGGWVGVGVSVCGCVCGWVWVWVWVGGCGWVWVGGCAYTVSNTNLSIFPYPLFYMQYLLLKNQMHGSS